MISRVITYTACLLALMILSRKAISAPPLNSLPPAMRSPLASSQQFTNDKETAAVRLARRLPPVTDSPSLPALNNNAGDPETLADAWAIALAVDRQLDAKRWNASSAEQSLGLARAGRWPSLSVEGSYTVRDNESAFRVLNPPSVLPYRQAESAALYSKLDVPLYTSGRIGHGIAAAAAELNVRNAEVRRWQMELKMRVADLYVSVLRAQRDLEVVEASVKSLQAHQRDVQMHFDHDRVPRNDLLAAQVALSDAQQLAIQVANRLDGNRAARNRILGRPLTTAVRLAEPSVPAGDVGQVEELTALALARRPERTRLAAEAEALRRRADSVRAGGLPQVGLEGDYSFAEDRFQVHEGIASLAVGVSWNMLDGGRSRLEANALRHRSEAAIQLAADLESQIGLAVRRSWLDVQETGRRLAVTEDALERAEENLRVARSRYVSGVGVGTEVLDAQTLRAQAYRNHVSARYDAVLAHLRLRRATGDL